MKREPAGFVDFGRWTAGSWTTTTPGTWIAVGYVYSRNERPYGICGPAVTVGRRTWAVFPLYSRAEHRARREMSRAPRRGRGWRGRR